MMARTRSAVSWYWKRLTERRRKNSIVRIHSTKTAYGDASKSGGLIGRSSLQSHKIFYRGQKLFRLLQRRAVPATRQLHVARACYLLDNLFVKRGWRSLIEFAAHDQ